MVCHLLLLPFVHLTLHIQHGFKLSFSTNHRQGNLIIMFEQIVILRYTFNTLFQ